MEFGLEAFYIVAIALGLAAIAVALVMRTFVEQPLRNAASSASNVPGIGGALSWLLASAANEVEYAINALSWIGQKGTVDAVNAMNSLTLGLMNWFLGDVIFWARTVGYFWGSIETVIDGWWGLVGQAFSVLPNWISNVSDSLNWLSNTVWGTIIPEVRGIEAGLRNLSDLVNLRVINDLGTLFADLANLHFWIDNVFMPGLRQALQGLNDWIGRVEANTNTRALQRDLDASNQRIAELERVVGILSALGILAVAGTDVIENIRCIGNVRCNLLSPLLSGDLEDRVTELEINSG